MRDLTTVELLSRAKELHDQLGWSLHSKVMLCDISLFEDLLHVNIHNMCMLTSSYLRGKRVRVPFRQTTVLDMPRSVLSFYTINIIMVLRMSGRYLG